jgi:carboxypeptidase T
MKYKLIILAFILLVLCSLNVNSITNKNLEFSNNQIEEYVYYNYEKMYDLLFDLEKNYSEIMSLTSIGKTYQGRDILLVKISDNVNINEDEPKVLFMGAHHGNEKPSYEILIYFIKYVLETYEIENSNNTPERLLNEDLIYNLDNQAEGLVDKDLSVKRVREIVNNTEIFIIPMVNPDGVEANSRKNCVPNHGPFGLNKEITSYGVNLNRNYGYDWILYKLFPFRFNFFINAVDSSFNYRGPYPFSENETKAIKNFVESQEIKISLSYHTYGEVIFYPWCHTTKQAPDEELYISIGENISKINKYRLIIGSTPIIPRLGGTLGTSENWLYGSQGIIAYTIELCKIRAPKDPNVVSELCNNHVGVNLYVCEIALNIETKINSKKLTI